MESVYLESTVVSYLVARPSRELVLAAHQSITRQWWNTERSKLRCVVSNEVLREISVGDAEMVRLRLSAIEGLPVLAADTATMDLVEAFMRTRALPPTMRTDAMHLAIAATANVHYLLTWNCKHLANAHILRRLEKEAYQRQLTLPRVCTPYELLEGAKNVYE